MFYLHLFHHTVSCVRGTHKAPRLLSLVIIDAISDTAQSSIASTSRNAFGPRGTNRYG